MVAVALLAVPLPAQANCAMPVGYRVQVEANKVTICPEAFGARTCPDPDGLLRRNEASGETAKLTDCDANGCFVDECVPPGAWQYGYARPYECHASSCGTYYFEVAQVTSALGTCERSSGLTGPVSFDGEVPWDRDREICGYGGTTGCGCSAESASVVAANAVVLGIGLWLISRKRRR
ncbi:MAG: hypothetical protein WBV82_06245 [Myxococcaceae bacterium]